MKISRSLFAIIATFLIAALPIAAPAQFSIGVGFTIGTPPPPLPYFAQPPAPYPNYQWTPGYWAWGPAGYYWVPGTWVAPPSVGMYWTPGFWGATAGGFGWNAGYWGPTVGFYGGINYGFGYPGTGFYGGSWNNGAFAYNTAVANVNKTVINNTYNKTVINKNVCNNCKNVSFNGGHGGTTVRPSQAQITSRKNGIAPTSSQKNQATIAGQDRNQLYAVNHGKPTVATSQRAFSNDNKPKNFAPVTTADKQAGAKIPTRGDNSAANNQFAAANKAAVNNKPLPTQNKPAATTQNKPATTTQNKPAATTQNKPAATTQHQPATTSQHPGSNSRMGSATRPAGQQNTHLRNNPARPNQAQAPNQMTRPNRHQQMQNQAMHQGQGAHQGGQNRPQGHPTGGNAGGRPPQGNGQGKPPQGNGQGKPPRARGHGGHRR